MDELIQLRIDSHDVVVPVGTSILKAAESAGIHIPVLCFMAHLTPNGLCRTCLVEIEDVPGLIPACITPVRAGSVVYTRSPDIDRARRTILEMLAASVDLSDSPVIQEMLQNFGAQPERFVDAKTRVQPVLDDNPVYIRDYSKCIMCWRCVQVCAEDGQFAYALNYSGRGFHTSISTFFKKDLADTSCVYCGQCIGVCPTGALKAKREYLLEGGTAPEDLFQQTRLPKRNDRARG